MEAEESYPFQLKSRWQVKNHVLTGITLVPWIQIIILWRHQVDWATYWHRALFLTLMACINSLLALPDRLLWHRRVAAQPLNPRPVFVLGHPRTGTTLLHNLLALDDGRFATATTFQAGFPSSFLWLEKFAWLLAPVLDERRPMDNMPLSFDTPAEDEIATNVLSAGASPYLSIVFMRRWRELGRLLAFEGPGAAAAFARWRPSFLWFLRKVTLRCGGCKPLLVKSPVHTARVRLLLDLFPQARFIFIHRHPLEVRELKKMTGLWPGLEDPAPFPATSTVRPWPPSSPRCFSLQVFQSSAHMADSYFWYTYLDRPTNEDITQYILGQGEAIHDAYIADRGAIPAGELRALVEKKRAQPLPTAPTTHPLTSSVALS